MNLNIFLRHRLVYSYIYNSSFSIAQQFNTQNILRLNAYINRIHTHLFYIQCIVYSLHAATTANQILHHTHMFTHIEISSSINSEADLYSLWMRLKIISIRIEYILMEFISNTKQSIEIPPHIFPRIQLRQPHTNISLNSILHQIYINY